MKCPKCNAEAPENTRFCSICGTLLTPLERVPISKTRTIQTPLKEFTRGSTISQRYEVIEELGRGGMGRVYKVLDKQIEEEIALKVLNPDVVSDEKTKQRFRNELKIARKITHKNICSMYHLTEEEGTLYITMEYIPGEDLKSFIRTIGQFTVGKTLSVAKQVCEGLAEAHKLGVVHRDLKPQNVMINREGNIRILDFGIARSLQVKKITEAGIIMGTADYMSPEQLEGRETDHRSDIYSLGVILFEMLTGKLPFEGDSPLSVALKHKVEPPPNPRSLNYQIPEDLNLLILKCLEKDVEDRYQTAEEILADLDKIESGIPTTDKLVPLKKSRLPIISKLKKKKIFLYGSVTLVLILITLSAFLLFKGNSISIRSIAVLPLKNLSGNQEQEYFADGMTEALISNLTQLGALERVISSTSIMQYKGVRKPLPEIARDLKVDAVIEGSVLQSGNRVRITVQLIEARTDRNLWSKSYERDLSDVLSLQSELAKAIAREIKVAVTPTESAMLATARSVNPEAYKLYLKGRQIWKSRTEEDLKKAIDLFNQAIEKDQTYALAYAAVADTYVMLGSYDLLPPDEVYPKAKNAALMAMQVDEMLAEAYTSLAKVKLLYDWDWFGAESDINWAIGLNPSYATAHEWYATLLMVNGRFDEAHTEIERARELNPLSPSISANAAQIFLYARQFDSAIEECTKILGLDADFHFAHFLLGRAYLQKGMVEEALKEFHRLVTLTKGEPISLARLAYAYAASGNAYETRKVLSELQERIGDKYVPQYELALVFAALGDKDQTFDYLERAYSERSSSLAHIKIDPRLDSIRQDPRFAALQERMGLD